MNSVVELPSNAIHIQTGAKKQFRLNIESVNTIQYTPNNEFIPTHPPNDVYTPPIIEPCDILSSHIDEPAQKQEHAQTEDLTEINTAPDLVLPIKPTIKYNIIDLFWIINPKWGTDSISKEEPHFITISFNMDFGNLRIAYFNIPNGALINNVLFHQKLQRRIAGTIYNSAVWKIAKNIKEDEADEFSCLEQLINYTGEAWQRERPHVYVQKSSKIIRLHIFDVTKKQNCYFDFENDHRDMLIHACNFALNDGIRLHGMATLNKGV